jgi:hypothetical protein
MANDLGPTSNINVSLLLLEGGTVDVSAAPPGSPPGGRPFMLTCAGGVFPLITLGGYVTGVAPAAPPPLAFFSSWKLANANILRLDGGFVTVNSA